MSHQLHILDRTGHTTLAYGDVGEAVVDGIMSVADAERAFNDKRAEGYMAYSGDGLNVLKQFDPNEREIIMAPPLVGG